MTGTPEFWADPIIHPIGSSRPVWLPVEEIDCEREDFLAQEAKARTQKQIFIARSSVKATTTERLLCAQSRTVGQLRFLHPTADLALQFQGDSALESSHMDVDRP